MELQDKGQNIYLFISDSSGCQLLDSSNISTIIFLPVMIKKALDPSAPNNLLNLSLSYNHDFLLFDPLIL